MEAEEKMRRVREGINPRWVMGVVGVILVLIIIFSLVNLLSRVGKIPVEVKYVPYAATVKLNGKKIANNAVNYIESGSYVITVEFENFESTEVNVEINDDVTYLYGVLNPINDAGIEYLNKHSEELSEIQDISDARSGKIKELLWEKYPLLNDLPINDPYYTIDYDMPVSEKELKTYSPEIIVKASVAYNDLAIAKLLELADDETFGIYDVTFENTNNIYSGKFIDNEATDPIQFIKNGYDGVGFEFEIGTEIVLSESGESDNMGWAGEDGDLTDEMMGGGEDGDYYYTYLRSCFDTYVGQIYRIVLIRDGAGWRLASDPYLLLTTFNTPDVPLDIINKVNRL